ncbi:MAG: outer membrane lipoprotein-sorting protein [Lentisphaerae bacterium]|jgi:outer membrane lipoprotein-sorting protein|nr:outer membrane lipoprotein-sorting protein [Lentisphaerota bacterium]
MKKIFLSTIALSLLLISPIMGNEEKELTGDELMSKSNQAFYYAGKDGSSDVEMTIRDAQGGTRTRSMTILRRNEGENQKYYVYFRSPADVRRMAYLVWKNVKGDDDRWLFLPALNLERRIAPGDKRTSFVGSDFFYEDVSGRNLTDDTHELVETTDEYYVVSNKPKVPNSVEFAEYKVWLDKTTFIPMRSEYYDKNGKLYRTVESKKVEEIDGYYTVMEAVASDLITGSSTVNSFSNVRYNLDLNANIFSQRFLRRPPREVTSRK